MRIHPRLAGFLTQALSHELTAVQQYLTQGTLCGLWGFTEEAAYFRREAGEELDHAEQIIRRMLTLGMAPNGSRLEPVRPGRDLTEMLTLDRGLELDAVYLYDDALRFCERDGDADSAALFAQLLGDEQHHLQELDRMLAALAQKETGHG